ncbi:MAG: hypothetical protein UR39_C0001G0120 [Candidatus Woesebacteria bacterium GW2011_GWA1_33_30]|uniref:Glycosyltransferase RgtA/B/C/D-like domain-containing protein n=1 Tax=Candidatus Woesebacteria bacterium GW2011_GWA2_33_28 TaxID=1618561 RepID=A0A0G0CAV6_9BACT|nr:MAG: hypothetical protein UR38_C0001G0121 [Candidatus Woesebacteria bacterium GW2011_GWA2_33_28]KKP49087.1 MAG: hypothetical protein UR39_C0001G0120 [Candidatus Woesebacteria bacterium GW2011_GWA1_33_30]KKP50313.1 MAG: hypothetical protein UR40_C0001G0055 [Microgenomates group bacterium GW2011_GWC1_33_32]KKP52678.1 MAG: hypothetical protein UR44_C0001G0120 [Candidatus Woesebacteria bacterium GW2011_GWB1_33_38]
MKFSKTILIIYFITLFVRLWNFPNHPIYSDEITWMTRSKELIYALSKWNTEFLKTAWWTYQGETPAIGLPLSIVSGISQIVFAGQSKYSLNIFSDIVAARLPIIFLTSLISVFVYKIGLYLNKKIALLAGFLYALNPVLIGIEKWAINDGLLTLFSITAIYYFIKASLDKKINLIPAIFLSLAFLTKPLGLLVIIPWFFIVKPGKLFFYNLLFFFVMIQVFWPLSWFLPFISIFDYLYRVYFFVQGNYLENFYFGVSSTNPHWSYYLFQIFARLTEITIIGLLIGLFNLNKKYLPFLIYTLIYLAVISFSSQKIDIRYALPTIPVLVIISSEGITKLIKKLPNIKLIIFALIIIPLIWLKSTHIYFNNFVGGAKGAQKYVLVGWCTSEREALNYLNSIKAIGSVYIAGCPSVTPYYSPLPLTYDFRKSDYIILETYYLNQHPKSDLLTYLKDKKEIKAIIEKGATISLIFKN